MAGGERSKWDADMGEGKQRVLLKVTGPSAALRLGSQKETKCGHEFGHRVNRPMADAA